MKAPLGLLLAALLLTGCAAKSANPSAAGPSTEASPARTSPTVPSPRATSPGGPGSAEPTISLPPKVPKTTKVEPPADAFQQVIAQGRVRVTGSCVELVTDQLTWTLIGPDAARLRDGQQARVTGVPHPDRETTCTGSPLLVSQATPL
jgi:hypothetical protein